jgi:catechol 2,3-dioxygenase-like lactoylglutathione lyase family enzyme
MQLDQINLVVADMDATVAFYRLLGLEIPDTVPEFQLHHRSAVIPGGMELDFDSIEFAAMWNEGSRAGSGSPVVGFRLDNREAVDETYARMVDAGHESRQAPYDSFWGARYAVIADPDGHPVGLMSPRDMARRTAPPSPGG